MRLEKKKKIRKPTTILNKFRILSPLYLELEGSNSKVPLQPLVIFVLFCFFFLNQSSAPCIKLWETYSGSMGFAKSPSAFFMSCTRVILFTL